MLAVGQSYQCSLSGAVTEGLDEAHRNTLVVGADRATVGSSSSAKRLRQLPGTESVSASDIALLPAAQVYGQDSAWALVLPPLPVVDPQAIPIGGGILVFLILGLLGLARRRL